jgi:hypothetical protein
VNFIITYDKRYIFFIIRKGGEPMERESDSVQPIGKSWPVRKIGALRLHRRRLYKPKLKGGFISTEKDDDLEATETVSTNQAHHSPEGVGERIDFKA